MNKRRLLRNLLKAEITLKDFIASLPPAIVVVFQQEDGSFQDSKGRPYSTQERKRLRLSEKVLYVETTLEDLISDPIE